jgi:Leucine-rich repeat (LRR) protein
VIKGRKMAILNEYITRIENQDATLTSIDLFYGLNDADADRLMQAFRNAPEIAKNITSIDLSNNQLTSINIPATLIALQWLELENNRLTAATKIALTAFGIIRPALEILIEENIPEQLTPAILDNHFKPMLEVNPDKAINYLKKIGAMHCLTSIPPELVRMLCKMEPPLEIVQANDSMTNFKNIFSMLPILHDGANPQLDILNAYKESRFKNLLNAAEKYYGSVIDSLNSVVNARRNASRNAASSNQPAKNADSSCDNESAKRMCHFSI